MVRAPASLPPLVQALLRPEAYPDPVDEVKLLQTHVSYIFLAGEFAYKIKKPLNLGFLDFSTLERREHFCRREVELNRRLCPTMYLGVVPVTFQGQHARLGGDGRIVEWAVHMRRLPEDRLLTALLARDQVSAADIARVARELAAFHDRAETSAAIDRYGDPATIAVNTNENFAQMRPFIGRTCSPDDYARIRAYTDGFFQLKSALFERRVAAHRIRDCHGDLHLGSICIADQVSIFDCIEFNDRLRYGDVLDDVAFLAMDLEREGHGELARAFVAAYRDCSGDECPPDLLDFYKCYRAFVRCKVASFRLDEPEFSPAERSEAQAEARGYAQLAVSYTG